MFPPDFTQSIPLCFPVNLTKGENKFDGYQLGDDNPTFDEYFLPH